MIQSGDTIKRYMNQVTIEKTPKYLIVKIPLTSVQTFRAELSPKSRRDIHRAIAEGLSDIEAGRSIGPFKNVKDFRKAIRAVTRK